jgi:hypothetical protein
LRVKRNEKTDKRRILSRNDTNGRIQIVRLSLLPLASHPMKDIPDLVPPLSGWEQNFNLYPALAPKQTSKSVSFTGFDADGTPRNFMLRVKTEEMAEKFVEKVKEEVAKLT